MSTTVASHRVLNFALSILIFELELDLNYQSHLLINIINLRIYLIKINYTLINKETKSIQQMCY